MTNCATKIGLASVMVCLVGLGGHSGKTLKPFGIRQQQMDPSAGGKSPTTCERHVSTAQVAHAYHSSAPKGPLPATLDPEQFSDNKRAFVAYSIAAKIPELLYQEPCYCPCDKLEKHQSLLDCFVGKHGFACPTCQTELVFIYEQSKKGKTPPQIREAIERGDAWNVDGREYLDAHYEEYRKQRSGLGVSPRITGDQP